LVVHPDVGGQVPTAGVRWSLLVRVVGVACGAAVLVGVAALIVSVAPSHSTAHQVSTGRSWSATTVGPPAAAGASATPTIPGAVVPMVAAPPGYSGRPGWQVPVAGFTRTTVDAGGTVYTRTGDGRLVGLSPVTGAVTWTAAGTWPSGWAGPWATRIDGHPATPKPPPSPGARARPATVV
jgi:hypothetical protein